ncbi:MAG TPA: MFS transporter [Methylomirabilota bacterium]|jgi:MFS family permease|nr:MFS transporter [Methylomirabilota bacterium]
MTTIEQKQSGIFHGWWIVLVAAIGLSMGYGPIVTFTFGVFFKPLSQEFNWNRAQVSLAFSLSLFVMSLAFPLVGRLVDRFGARRVIVPSVLGFGLGLLSFALLTPRLWHLYVIYILLGVVGGGTAPVPYSNVLSHWFDKQRGLALGVAMVGLGLSAFIMPSLAQRLIDVGGWRWAYICIGLTVMVVTIPIVAVFLKETPQMIGLTPDGEPATSSAAHDPKEGLSSHEAQRTGAFWLMLSAFFLMSACVHGCLIHLAPLLTDRGVSPQQAALAASLLGGALLLGRVGAGYLLDHFFASAVAVVFFGGAALGFMLLWGGATGSLAFAAAFLIGLGMGAEGDIIAYLVSRYFGLLAFSEIYGYAFAAFTLGGVVGPLLMGVGFDATGSYQPMLGAFVLASLVAAALMTRLGPYRVWQPAPEAAV